MKKLLSIVFAAIICMPGYAAPQKSCETEVRSKYNPLYKFDNDPEYKQLYEQMSAIEQEKLEQWKKTKRTENSTGDCNYRPYTCQSGQTNEECVPADCWELLAGIKRDMFLDNAVRDAFIEQKIKDECGNSEINPKNNEETDNTSNYDFNVILTLTDKETKKNITDAHISVEKADHSGWMPWLQKANNGSKYELKHMSKGSKILIEHSAHDTQTIELNSPQINISLTPASNLIKEVVVTECSPKTKDGIKTQKLVNDRCIPTECYGPCYKLTDNKCVLQKTSNGTWQWDSTTKTCTLTCNSKDGYIKSSDNLSCIKDCLSTVKNKEPLATKAEYDSNGKCIIKKCDKKDGKKYIPSDDGQKCEETERDCNKQSDSQIWPEYAIAASYQKSKTGGAAKCVPTECESGYDVDGGKCVSVNDSDCDKKPENSKKSHRYYDASTQKTLCIIDECKDGYKISNDMLSCILESALSEEDSKKRMEELKENAQKMKEKEQSFENKLLGAAGIATVGIGGMNIASALSEQSADKDAEADMKAYLATFRCDYGQGRNILGGETGIQLPGASELIQYTTEYKQLATDLKASKDALGMLPGIESETVFDSATTGLYDDVGIGTQKGAFTSLSRALMDAESADAAEWQAMKDATAKKLKTGAIVAGAGALGTLAANIAINHGKGNKSDDIMNQYDNLKEDIPDITLPRIPCSNFPDTTGVGYVPNCECKTNNSYFDEKTRKCEQCGTNEHVENKQCVCNDGFHRDNNGNCVANQPKQTCQNLPAGSGATGTGDFPNCNCTDQNATFNQQTLKCECKTGYSNPNGGQCLPICAGLPGVDNSRASNYNVPNCPCEYSGATFDASKNACVCLNGQTPAIENGQKKCITPETGTPCNSIAGATGTIVPNCTCTDSNKEFKQNNGKYGCHCKNGMHEDASGNCISGNDPVFSGNFSTDEAFDRGAYDISPEKCTQAINKIKRDDKYDANISGLLCINVIGHTDTKYFKDTLDEKTNLEKNQMLSENRAKAMYDCINKHVGTLFPKATVTSSKTEGKNWQECEVQTLNTDTPSCRRVEVKIQLNSCK